MLDEFRSTLITWDKATSRIYSPVTANASDENGRKLVVQIVNSGQVEDLTGATLHLYWETRDKAHDGLDVFKTVDLKKGEFELSYTTGMLSNQGVLNANLVLIDTVGRVVSERFKITVTEGIDDDAIQSENSFSSLTQALIDVSNLEQNYAPRLNDLTTQLQQTEQELSSQLANKTNEQDVINLLGGVSNGTPLFADSVSAMVDTSRNYVNTTDGFVYSHNGTEFVKTAVQYQTTGIGDGTVEYKQLSKNALAKRIPRINLFKRGNYADATLNGIAPTGGIGRSIVTIRDDYVKQAITANIKNSNVVVNSDLAPLKIQSGDTLVSSLHITHMPVSDRVYLSLNFTLSDGSRVYNSNYIQTTGLLSVTATVPANAVKCDIVLNTTSVNASFWIGFGGWQMYRNNTTVYPFTLHESELDLEKNSIPFDYLKKGELEYYLTDRVEATPDSDQLLGHNLVIDENQFVIGANNLGKPYHVGHVFSIQNEQKSYTGKKFVFTHNGATTPFYVGYQVFSDLTGYKMHLKHKSATTITVYAQVKRNGLTVVEKVIHTLPIKNDFSLYSFDIVIPDYTYQNGDSIQLLFYNASFELVYISVTKRDRLYITPNDFNRVMNSGFSPTEHQGDEITLFNKTLSIGDSLTRGTFNTRPTSYHENVNYAFPAYLSKMTGVPVTNKGSGGKTTQQWYELYLNDDLSGYDSALIQLGVNDVIYNVPTQTTLNYLQLIVDKLKAENKGIKIFISTIIPATSYTGSGYDTLSEAIRGFANSTVNCYLVDLAAYGHTGDEVAYNNGHLSALGYMTLAKDWKAYVSYIINQNKLDFRNVQFIGTDLTY